MEHEGVRRWRVRCGEIGARLDARAKRRRREQIAPIGFVRADDGFDRAAAERLLEDPAQDEQLLRLALNPTVAAMGDGPGAGISFGDGPAELVRGEALGFRPLLGEFDREHEVAAQDVGGPARERLKLIAPRRQQGFEGASVELAHREAAQEASPAARA